MTEIGELTLPDDHNCPAQAVQGSLPFYIASHVPLDLLRPKGSVPPGQSARLTTMVVPEASVYKQRDFASREHDVRLAWKRFGMDAISIA